MKWTEEDYKKRALKREARRIQAEEGVSKYTEALRIAKSRQST